MNLQEAKRQRRLKRIYNQILHEKRLRIPKYRFTSQPEQVSWWQRLLRFFKSFFKWPTTLHNSNISKTIT